MRNDPPPSLASRRLQDWRRQHDYTLDQAAEVIGCHPSFVSFLENGKRTPGRRVANAIERVTRGWKHGPIAATEWDVAA